MIRFLRLFSEFRRIEALNTAFVEQVMVLARQNSMLIEKFDAARCSELDTLRKVADHAARKHGSGIFDLASEIPVRAEAYEPIPRGKPQGSDLADKMEREFVEAQQAAAERMRATA